LQFKTNHSFYKLLFDTCGQTLLAFDCAPGKSPLALERHFSFIVWLCRDEEESVRIRRIVKEAGCTGISILIANLNHLPFRQGFFDVVAVHRLEKCEISNISDTISEVSKQLSNKGTLYISFEFGRNPVSSRIYSWIVNRTITRICRKSCLKKQAKAFYYRDFEDLYFLRYFWVNNVKRKISSYFDEYKYNLKSCNSAYIYSSNRESNNLFRSRALIGKIKRVIEDAEEIEANEPDLIRMGSGGSIVIDYGIAIARLPFTESGSIRCANNFSTLIALTKRIFPIAVPRPVLHGSIDNQEYYIESKLSGLSMDLCQLPPKQLRYIEKQAFSVLTMQENIVTGKSTSSEVLASLYNEVRCLEFFLGSRQKAMITDLIDWAESISNYGSIPQVIEHGDFKKSNFLVARNPKNKLTGLIDWDLSRVNGLPLVDALTLRACSVDPKGLYLPGIKQIVFLNKADHHLTQYCEKMKICRNAAKLLLIYSILKYLNTFSSEEKSDSVWYNKFFDKDIPELIHAIIMEKTQLVNCR
jgi:hypothetical protein